MLSIKGLEKRFGGLHVTRDVSFDVPEGACFGIIGPNGAGKTTLFNQFAGAIKPDAGEISFEGRNINGLPIHEIAKRGLARTFQIATGFPELTVEENITIGALVRHRSHLQARSAARKVLKKFQLAEVSSMPVQQLPVQMKKRVGVAVALATEPRMLLLDEVMAGLNPSEVSAFVDLLQTINSEGVTLLFIEHNIRAIRRLCPTTLVLALGSVLAVGPTEDVLNNPDVITAYLGKG